jgi:hypothetical protein
VSLREVVKLSLLAGAAGAVLGHASSGGPPGYRRELICGSVKETSCGSKHSDSIDGKMSLYSTNLDGFSNCIIEQCSSSKVLTDPKYFGLQNHGSLLMFKKTDHQEDFQKLMTRITEKLNCLLDKAGPKIKGSDGFDMPWFLCEENKSEFLNQTQSELNEVIEKWAGSEDKKELLKNIVVKLNSFDSAVKEKSYVDKCTKKFHDPDYDHSKSKDSGCPFPGHFWDVRSFLPTFYIEILNNYLISIGSEPVQPPPVSEGDTATALDGIVNATNANSDGDGVGDQSGIDLLPILLPVFAGLSVMFTSATLARCRFKNAPLPNTNSGTDPENPPTLDLKKILELIAGPTGSFVREQILPTGAAVVYYALSAYLLSDSIEEDDVLKKNSLFIGGGVVVFLMMLSCCCRCKPEIPFCSERAKTETEFQKSIIKKAVLTKDGEEAISDEFDNSNKFNQLKSLRDKLNEGNLDPVYDQIKALLNQLAGIKGAKLSLQQRRKVQNELRDIFQKIDPARLSDQRFEFTDGSCWSNLLEQLNLAAGSSSLKTDSHLIMDIFNVVAKLAVLGFNSVSGQPLQYRMLALVGSMLFDAATYGHARLSPDSPNKERLAYAKLVQRILYLHNEQLLVNQPQSPQSVQGGQSRAASGQDNDAASNASHPVQEPIPRPAFLEVPGQANDASSDALQSGQRVQSPAASGQDNAAASNAPQSGQGVPAPVEPAPSLTQNSSADGGSASPQNPEVPPVNPEMNGHLASLPTQHGSLQLEAV